MQNTSSTEIVPNSPRSNAASLNANAFLSCGNAYVRGLEKSDLPSLASWINDHDVTRLLFTGHRPALTERLVEQWEQEWRSQSDFVFAVCMKEDDRFVGTTGLYNVNGIMRTAEFRIFLGDKTIWGRGVGTSATRMMVFYGFEKLNLNRVWLGVNAENVGGVKAYERARFVREGVLRQEQYRNFRYYDVVRMSMLRSEYEGFRENYLMQDPQG